MLKHNGKDIVNKTFEKVKKTPFQTAVLKELFSITKFPSTQMRRELSFLIDIPMRPIQVWFQNTRQSNRIERRLNGDDSSLSNQSEEMQLLTLIKIIRICYNNNI